MLRKWLREIVTLWSDVVDVAIIKPLTADKD